MSRVSNVILCLIYFSISSSSQTIFSDNFNRTTLGSNWVVRYGNWSIENNKLKHVGDGSFDPNFVLYANDITSSTYTIECSLLWQSNGYFEDGISVFHKALNIAPPGNNGGKVDNYFLALISSYSGGAYLARSVPAQSGTRGWNCIYMLDSAITQNTWYNFKVQVTKISVDNVDVQYLINGKRVIWFSGNVDSVLSNKVGLGGFKGQYGQVVYFDDFKIYGPSGPTNSIKEQNPSTPSDFKLLQNYPNPFNPNTTIEFNIPSRSSD